MGFSTEQIAELKNLFQSLDKDGSGAISKSEFAAALKDAGLDISDEEVMAKIAEADKDKSGEIDFNEFVAQIEKNC